MKGNKKTENYNTSCDLDPPHTLSPRLPDVCEKNVFRFIRSSASGKQHLIKEPQFETNKKLPVKSTCIWTTFVVTYTLRVVGSSVLTDQVDHT